MMLLANVRRESLLNCQNQGNGLNLKLKCSWFGAIRKKKILIQIGWLNCSETLSQPKNDYRFRLSLVAASCRNDRFLLFLLGEHHQVRDRRLSDHFQWASLWVCVFEKRSPKSTEYELKCSIVHCSMFSHWMFCPHGLVSELNGIKCKKKLSYVFHMRVLTFPTH